MTDSVFLLDAIRANPKEDLPRLLYADHLDEHGTCDRDRATVEFIRLSCDMSQGGRRRSDLMPRVVYHWLPGNWRRLVPSVLAVDKPYHGKPQHRYWVKGRYVDLYLCVREFGAPKLYTITLEFWRGFVVRVVYCSSTLMAFIRQPLTDDQPLWDPGRVTRVSSDSVA